MHRTARRFRIAATAVAILLSTTLGLLAWHLWSSQQSDRALLLQQAGHRAGQLAASAAGRVGAIVRSVDFVLLEVRSVYGVDETAFHALVDRVRASFPEEPGLLLQLSVAAADGELVYSTLGLTRKVNIADRDAFRAHLDGADRLYVSAPVIGRISGEESILFTRPVLRDARFAGTAAISLSLRQLDTLLASFDTASDAEIALLGRGDAVLALSAEARRSALPGRKLPGIEPLAAGAASTRGALHAGVFGDGAEHVVARHGVAGTGLAVVAALDWNAVLEPLRQQFRRTRDNAAALAAALVLLGGSVVALLLRMSAQQQAVQASEARFRSLTQLSSDWYWEQDERFRFTHMTRDNVAHTGLLPGTHLGRTRWDIPALNLTESDWARHRAALEAHQPFHDFEMRRPDTASGPHWVSVSGEPMFDERGRFSGYRGVGRDITDRKLAEQAVRELTERMQIGQVTARMIVMDWYVAEDRIEWSDSPEWLRGPLPASGRYPLWKDQVHPEDRERFLAVRNRSVATLAGDMQDYRLVRTDGEVRWLRAHQTVFAGRDGKAARMIVALLDITERKAAEERLQRSEACLAEAQRIAQIGNWELDLARDVLFWSDEVYRIFEIEPAVFGGTLSSFYAAVHPEDRAAVGRAYARSLETREPYQIEHRLRMADGRLKWVEERCETEFGADGAPLRSLGTVQDITERRLTEQALRESQATLAGVIDTAMDAIITIDERQRILSFNPAAERIFGYRADEMLARPVGDLLPERLRRLHHDHVERFGESVETRRPMGVPGEIIGLCRDGAEIRLEATIARVAVGERLRFSVMLRDVTERRRIEQRVREQARLLDLIFRHSIDNIVLLDRDFNYLRVSVSYARTCQREIAEFEGRNHFDLYPSNFEAEAERARDSKTIYHRTERPFVFPDHPEWGTTYWDIALVPILGANGEVELLLLTLKDVSERVRASTALRDSAARLRRLSSRLRGVEERERRAMARELHDRIGQNLSTLNLGFGMLGQQIATGRFDGADEQLAEMQQTLRAVIGHARDLMSELRPPALEEYGLLASLQDLAADFGRKTRIAARVEGTPLEPRPPDTIEIAMYRIAQEALNNAAKHARATQVRLSLASSDDTIELAISDDGVGFGAAQPNNGDPTWGLTTMRERAEEAGIELAIDSAPARGTRVTLRARREA